MPAKPIATLPAGMRRSGLLLALLVICSIAGTALANNTWFATRGAVANMTDEDREYLKKATDKILNKQADGTSLEWSNPESGAGGKLQVAGTHQDFGTTCRLLRMTNTSKGISRTGDFRLCADNEGIWRFAPTSGNSASTSSS